MTTPPANDEPDALPARNDRLFVTALARGLEVLKCFKSGEERLGNQDIADRSKLPKSTVSRLTYTLTTLGYLHQVERTGRYRLGTATLALGGATLSRLDVKDLGRPLMQALATDIGALVALGMRDEMTMLYIEACRGNSMVTLRLDVGSRLPVANSAIGRAYLAAAPTRVREELEDRLRSLYPAAWPLIEKSIRQAMDDLAAHGCVCSFGDWHPDINAIAVPLVFDNELPLMALNAASPVQTMSSEILMNEVRPKLIACAREIQLKVAMTS